MTSVMVVLTYFISLFLIIVNINKYMHFAEGIDREISLIKAWRKSDNRFKKILLSNENNTDDEVRPFNN